MGFVLAAVTGPTGMVGANLVRMLLERGVRARALTCGDSRAVAGLAVPLMRVHNGAGVGRLPLTRFTLHTLKHHRLVSHAKATQELGYSPRPIEDPLRDTFAWFEEMGRLGTER